MYCIYIGDRVICLSLCLVNTFPLWWVEGCQFSCLCKYPVAFRVAKCLVLFSVSCLFIYLIFIFFLSSFIYLLLNLSLILAKSFSSETISPPRFSETQHFYRFTLLCVCWRCQMALHPTSLPALIWNKFPNAVYS